MANRIDNFNRTDSPTTINPPSDGGSNYTIGAGTFGVAGNKGYTAVQAAPAAAVLDSTTTDVTVVSTITDVTPASDKVGITARYSDISNHWTFYQDWSANKTRLYKIVATAFVQVIDDAGAPVSGDALSLGFVGDTWTAKINGTQVGTGSDSFNNTATEHGLWSYNVGTSATWDTLSITDASGATILTPPSLLHRQAVRRAATY